MMKAKLFAVISSFLMLIGCGSYSESTPAVTVQSENSSVMMQSESSATVTFETNGTSDTVYTVQDVRNLNNFLLAKPTEEDRQIRYGGRIVVSVRRQRAYAGLVR